MVSPTRQKITPPPTHNYTLDIVCGTYTKLHMLIHLIAPLTSIAIVCRHNDNGVMNAYNVVLERVLFFVCLFGLFGFVACCRFLCCCFVVTLVVCLVCVSLG